MAPVVITKLRDMLCRTVLCYAFRGMLRSGDGTRDDMIDRAYVAQWLARYNSGTSVIDRLMGKLVNVAFNRGDESLGRVGLPS
jgi:hypothetical protein